MTVTNPAAEAVKAEFPCEWRSAGWGDDPAERPSSVELWLLRDGALWEQVILTEDDHWCRTWNGLEPGHRWQVTEPEVPEGTPCPCPGRGSCSP